MRSNHTNDIIGQDPNWLVRWGISSMLIFVLILLFLSNLITYPDINVARVELTSKSPPLTLYARTSGYVEQVFVSDGDTVNNGDILAVIKNNSDLNQIIVLTKWLDVSEITSLKNIININVPILRKLGELQPLYSNLLVTHNKACQYIRTDSYNKKIAKSTSDLNFNKELLEVESKKHEIIKQDLSLLNNDVDRNKKLFEQEVISISDMEKYNRSLLQKMMEVQQVNANLINIKKNINSTSESIQELNDQKRKEDAELFLDYNNLIKELKISYREWSDKYLICANIKGKIAFFKKWEKDEFINSSDLVLTIIPLKNHQIFATGNLPIANSGKVKLGQIVNIKLDDYPFKEFGILKGEIIYISQTQKEGFYSIRVKVSKNLSFHNIKQIQWFKSRMLGSAEIITENLTLFQRLLFKFKDINIEHE